MTRKKTHKIQGHTGNNIPLAYVKQVRNIQLTVCAKLAGTTAKLSTNKTTPAILH